MQYLAGQCRGVIVVGLRQIDGWQQRSHPARQVVQGENGKGRYITVLAVVGHHVLECRVLRMQKTMGAVRAFGIA